MYTYYLSFNNQLRSFLELKKNKYGYGRKLSIKTESVFQWRGQSDKEANKTAYEKVLRSEEFRKINNFDPLFVSSIQKVYEINCDLEDFKENIRVYNEVYGEGKPTVSDFVGWELANVGFGVDTVMKEHRLIVVLEKQNMSNEDIEKFLVINNETEDLSRKERGVKDSIEVFFMIEDDHQFKYIGLCADSNPGNR